VCKDTNFAVSSPSIKKNRFMLNRFSKHQLRVFVILIFSLTYLTTTYAQDSRKHRIYEAYIHSNRLQWVQVVNDMERSSEPKTLAWKLELAEYYYGMAGYYIGVKRKDLAEVVIEKSNTLIDGILKEYPGNATAMAFKGSMTAFKINLSRYKVLVLGRESLLWMDKALKADPNNIQALADRGNAYVHAPTLFGGDPELGIQLYKKGLALLEKRNLANGNWFYLNLLITTAGAYKRIGQLDKARFYYEKTLQVEPRFQYVKEILLPGLDKKS
jgi:tetratricopeptide (TPR) repeat protein